MYYLVFHFFFFFNQKTAYEMRISDWSSDVCSSDLVAAVRRDAGERRRQQGACRRPFFHRRLGRGIGRRHLCESGNKTDRSKQQRAKHATMKARTHRLRRTFHLPHGHIIPISGLPCPAGGRSIAPLLVVLPSQKTRNIDPVALAPLS